MISPTSCLFHLNRRLLLMITNKKQQLLFLMRKIKAEGFSNLNTNFLDIYYVAILYNQIE